MVRQDITDGFKYIYYINIYNVGFLLVSRVSPSVTFFIKTKIIYINLEEVGDHLKQLDMVRLHSAQRQGFLLVSLWL